MGFLSSIWIKLLAAGAVLLGILLAVLRLQAKAEDAGANKVARKDAEAEAAARKRMQEAGDNAPQNDSDFVDRLRRDGL